MGIRTIRKAGKIIAFQAIGGAGTKGATEYFSVAKHGLGTAMILAAAADKKLRAQQPRRVYKPRGANAKGIPGLRFEYRSTSDGAVPVLYAAATWMDAKGRARASHLSTQKHGLLGAVELAIQRREAGTGQLLGITARQALNRMQKAVA